MSMYVVSTYPSSKSFRLTALEIEVAVGIHACINKKYTHMLVVGI